MKIIGLTGGIGSGKSSVAKYMSGKGIPVYIADDEAKKIMEEPIVLESIKNAFGDSVFDNGQLNRQKLAEKVFDRAEDLAKLNAIVHPAVRNHFKSWLQQHHDSPFVIKEAAVLFESGSYKDCDKIIVVTAPEAERLQRVIKRDGVDADKVLKRMQNQWPEEEKIKWADFVIYNSNWQDTMLRVDEILKEL